MLLPHGGGGIVATLEECINSANAGNCEEEQCRPEREGKTA